MAIRFFDPRPPTPESRDSYAVEVPRGQARRIGLLANGFPDSMAFLDAVARALASAAPDTRFVRVEKMSPPTPLTAEQVRMLTDDCDGVIAAYGH